MNKNSAASIAAAFIVVLIVTTLVLPERDTPGAINSFFNLLSTASKTLIGKSN